MVLLCLSNQGCESGWVVNRGNNCEVWVGAKGGYNTGGVDGWIPIKVVRCMQDYGNNWRRPQRNEGTDVVEFMQWIDGSSGGIIRDAGDVLVWR